MYLDDLVTELGAEGRKRRHDEDDLQAAVVTFLRWALPADAWHWSVPNGGRRHTREAARMSRLGLTAGVPDLHVVYRGRLHCIELKAPRGTLSAVQAQAIEKLFRCGVPVVTCRSVEAVENALRVWGIPMSARLT